MREKSYVARLGALALVLTLMTTYLTGHWQSLFRGMVKAMRQTVAAWEFGTQPK